MHLQCIAYTDTGRLCRQPATLIDVQRGGMMCAAHTSAHASRDWRPSLSRKRPFTDQRLQLALHSSFSSFGPTCHMRRWRIKKSRVMAKTIGLYILLFVLTGCATTKDPRQDGLFSYDPKA